MMRRSGTDAREQRRHPRTDVSLPVRFTPDGARFVDGVLTSLSVGGVFIQCDASPGLRSELWLDVGLGDAQERLRIQGRVVNLDRRIGHEVIRGLGLQFLDPPADLERRLAAFLATYPGRLLLEPGGAIRWPIEHGGEGRGHSDPGPGLRVWAARRWRGDERSASGGGASIALGRSPAEYVAMVHALGSVLRTSGEALSAVAYQGHALVPQDGVPRLALLAELEASGVGPSGWLALLTAQMRLIDDLGASAWRLEELWPEQIEALRATPGRLRAARNGLAGADPPSGTSAGSAPQEQAQAGLEALDRFTERLLWSAATLLPAEVTSDAFEGWRQGRREATRRRTRLAKQPSTTRGVRRLITVRHSSGGGASRRRRNVLLALALVGTVSGSGVYLWQRTRAVLGEYATAQQPLTLEELSEWIPVDAFHLDGDTLVLSVPFEWRDRPREQASRDLAGLCTELAVRGYSRAAFQAPDGTIVALWRDGSVKLMR